MTDDEAHHAFVSIRFAENEGKPFCVWCGCTELYGIKTRKKWKCQSCLRQFSVTSQTIFASRKLPIRTILYAIAIFTNGAKGMSALHLGRELDVQYKTAFVLAHIRCNQPCARLHVRPAHKVCCTVGCHEIEVGSVAVIETA